MQIPFAAFADLPVFVPRPKRRPAQTPQEKERKQRLQQVLQRKGRLSGRISRKPESVPLELVTTEPDTLPLGDATALYALFLNPYSNLRRTGFVIQLPSQTKACLTWAKATPPELRLPKGYPTGRTRQTEMIVAPGQPERISVKAKQSGDILPDGGLQTEDEWNVADIAFLQRLLTNPQDVLAEAGREMGLCVFCGRRLSDERSARLGYGKTCGAKFGMDWRADTDDNPVAVEAALSQSESTNCDASTD